MGIKYSSSHGIDQRENAHSASRTAMGPTMEERERVRANVTPVGGIRTAVQYTTKRVVNEEEEEGYLDHGRIVHKRESGGALESEMQPSSMT